MLCNAVCFVTLPNGYAKVENPPNLRHFTEMPLIHNTLWDRTSVLYREVSLIRGLITHTLQHWGGTETKVALIGRYTTVG
jgi:hypothetical protein